ncbi:MULTISPECIES: glycerophosphodiester phosphodiesterase family protein [unclassified Variovorax]|uniref:glycerophosphodiester phosphodiesterase family protein n=1 Tax=unclassified Variovorax TaxID=663243 RepID=UPI003F446B8A
MAVSAFLPTDDSCISTTALIGPSNPRVLVAAHRGAWRELPENSISALDDAIAQGADIIELDVRATRDDVLVLLHDPTLERTTTGRGAVAALDFDQVRRARLKPRDGGSALVPTHERLPTLASALEAARDRVVVNIDVKDTLMADHVAQAVIAAGMADQVFVKATITEQRHVDQVRASPFFGRIAFVPMMQARPGRFAEDLRWLEPLGCLMYEVGFADLADLEAGRDELRRQGARLWVNTIDCSHSLDFNDTHALQDADAVWGRLLDIGVGAIQTDVVPDLVAYLARSKHRQGAGAVR